MITFLHWLYSYLQETQHLKQKFSCQPAVKYDAKCVYSPGTVLRIVSCPLLLHLITFVGYGWTLLHIFNV